MDNYWFLYVGLYTYVVWFVFKRDFEYETEIARTGVVMEKRKGRLTTESPIGTIAVIAVTTILILCPLIGMTAAMMSFAQFLIQYFIVITICHILLLIVLPILRDYISARACSYMWILPAIFSIFIRITRRNVTNSFVTVKIPESYAKIAFWVWIVGFIIVMAYKTFSHLAFRKAVLKDAMYVTDRQILDLWEKEQALIERNKQIPLLVSDKIASPMTIGIFNDKLRAVLPHTEYNEEELQLIFRHELRHIQRQDNHMKMFLAECQAFCWFNPLMWIAAEKAAQDIELSCDEMVLYGASEEKRRKYARLLLDTAGDSRGYTTCLSASARTLRYRLKNIMNVRKKFPGAEVVAGMMALLLMSTSVIAVNFNQGTTGEITFRSIGKEKQPMKAYISSVSFKNQSGYRHNSVYAWNEKELLAYVKSIKTTRIDPTEKFVSSRYEIAVHVQTGECLLRIKISDKMIEVTTYQNSDYAGLYQIEQEIDWSYVRSLLDFDAEK